LFPQDHHPDFSSRLKLQGFPHSFSLADSTNSTAVTLTIITANIHDDRRAPHNIPTFVLSKLLQTVSIPEKDNRIIFEKSNSAKLISAGLRLIVAGVRTLSQLT